MASKGTILFFVPGSLVDHTRRDCPALMRRVVERGKTDADGEPDVRQRYVTGRSVMPLCAVCVPVPVMRRAEGYTGRGRARARWTGDVVTVLS